MRDVLAGYNSLFKKGEKSFRFIRQCATLGKQVILLSVKTNISTYHLRLIGVLDINILSLGENSHSHGTGDLK